ncbi:hypothetical protein KTT_34330 [Tengunoibacter tsumagoiensis]|uniref:Uncharacterized protein n=1 Tax=Tengunoibacter tsumagoiensis TaxID=2014871 RepID=A0A402A356_9CHLR|nr:hypothetical protein KTT_34330 [Tengunoibacter tsumagoiensis]
MVQEQIKQVGWGNLESNLEDSSVLEEMFLQLFNYDQIDQEILLKDILLIIE